MGRCKIRMNSSNSNKKLLHDKIANYILAFFAVISASIVVFIILFITIKGLSPFFNDYYMDGKYYRPNFFKFLFGNTWFIPPASYSIGFIIINTLYVVFISLILSIPISIFSSLFITKIAPKKLGKILETIIEILSSIPSVIYGVFGSGVITVFVRDIANIFNIQTKGGISTLSASIVLAIMSIPTITILSITAIKSVDKDLEINSLALGATKMETNFKIVLVSAKSGIFAGIILGVGRALGEATAVSMVSGNINSGPNFNIFDTTRTLTSTMLQSIHETVGLDLDIRFSVGFILIIVLLITNYLLNLIKRKIGNMS